MIYRDVPEAERDEDWSVLVGVGPLHTDRRQIELARASGSLSRLLVTTKLPSEGRGGGLA